MHEHRRFLGYVRVQLPLLCFIVTFLTLQNPSLIFSDPRETFKCIYIFMQKQFNISPKKIPISKLWHESNFVLTTSYQCLWLRSNNIIFNLKTTHEKWCTKLGVTFVIGKDRKRIIFSFEMKWHLIFLNTFYEHF